MNMQNSKPDLKMFIWILLALLSQWRAFVNLWVE
jgi:hypothetical protein